MLTFELQPREALEISFAVSIVAGKGDPYTGAYKVTPKIYGPVVLETSPWRTM